MGTKLYGIGACESPDSADEILKIQGLDNSHLHGIRDEHDSDDFFHTLGAITYSKKILSDRDCENEYQLKCWKFAGAPFLYAEGELADDEDHPDAKAAAALLRFTSRNDVPLKIGFSVDGGTLERDTANPKILAKTLAYSLALTAKPCNKKCRTWLFNDLTKSELAMEPPAGYWEALKKSQATTSIFEVPDFKLYLKMEKLKKSLADYMGAFTDMKCWKCGKGIRFFKSSAEVPSACPSCGHSFPLADIWKAFNK